jgi:DNA-binding MarR family transcriptional regulator
VADRLHSAAIHILRSLRRTDEATGLSPARLSALSVIVFGGPLSLADLAAAEQVRPPTMSKIVGALEEEGLVKRSPDPNDGRAIRLSATATGVRVLERGRRMRVESLTARLQTLDRHEVAALDHAVEIMERVGGAETGRREKGEGV